MKRLAAIAAAMVIVGLGMAAWAAEPVKVRLEKGIRDLRASAMALTSGKQEAYGASLDKIADRITEWTKTHQTVRRTDLTDLEKFSDRMRRTAVMFSGASAGDKAALLSAQAEAVDRVCKEFATVVEEVAEPASAPAASVPAAAARGAVAHLTVRLTIGMPPPEGGAATPGAAPGAQPPMPGPGMGGERMGGERMGGERMGGERMGGEGYAAPRTMSVGAPTGRMGATARGLVITLVELNRMFGSPGELRGYVTQNAEKLAQTSITFEVAPEVAWKDVIQVVNAFSGAEFTGAMEFAGLALRGQAAAPAAAPLAAPGFGAVAPAAPGPAAPATAPAPPTAPAANPAAPGAGPTKLAVTPLGPGQGEPPPTVAPPTAEFSSQPLSDAALTPDGKLPQAVATFLAGRRSVLISLDVSAENAPAARKMVQSALEALGADATITICCSSAEGQTAELLRQKPNTLATREEVQNLWGFVTPPDRPGTFPQAVAPLAPAAGRMGEGMREAPPPTAAAALLITDGPRMTGSRDAESVARLSTVPTALVIVDRPPLHIEQAVSAAKSITAVYLPAKQLKKIGGGSPTP